MDAQTNEVVPKVIPWDEHKEEVNFWRELWQEVPIEIRHEIVQDLYDFPQTEDVEYD